MRLADHRLARNLMGSLSGDFAMAQSDLWRVTLISLATWALSSTAPALAQHSDPAPDSESLPPQAANPPPEAAPPP